MIAHRRPASSLALLSLIAALALGSSCSPAPASATPSPTVAPLVQIARNYAQNGDLIPARAALAGLALDDPIGALAQSAQQEAAAGRADDAEALAELAAALQATPPGPATATPPPSPEPPTRTPTAATDTPTPTGFELVNRERVCSRAIGSALLEVYTQDATGAQIGGYEIQVIWNGGADRFFTGLKPEVGPGYGDFLMEPGVNYRVRLAAFPDVLADDVISEACATETSSYPGGVRLVFRQVAR
jgi:hypothetical protein